MNMQVASPAKQILLVEDEALIALAEKKQLERFGYSVATAFSGAAALATLNSNPSIDLVLMDLDLGDGLDGPETALIIQEQIKKLPIIFLSSHTEPEIINKTDSLSSYGYVVKNSAITVLDASIKMAFRLFDETSKRLETQKRYEQLFDNLNDAFGIHEIICDEEGIPVDYRFLELNKAFLQRLRMKKEDVTGKRCLELFPNTEKEWIQTFGRVALSGEPEVFTHYSSEFNRYYEARIYSPQKGIFAALFVDLEEKRGFYSDT